MKIKFSKKLMEKFGEVILNRFDEKSRRKTSILYRIDWTNYRKEYLKDWLSKQVINPSKKLIDLSKRLKKKTRDETIISILKWVSYNIKYTKDKDRWGVAEKWQEANQTLDLKTGDCEDGAVLIYVLSYLCGIPANSMKVNCGEVVNGGHAWISYRSNSNGLDYFIDWCYYVNLVDIYKRKTKYELDKYIKIWWGFNNENYYKGYSLKNEGGYNMAKNVKSTKSKAFSLQNWELKEFLKGNWKTLKEVAKILAPALLTWLASRNPLWTIVVTGLGKIILDVGEFWIKEKK